ncbi:molecular chaperone DnaJ [Proteobacteria bacterium 005FR1]|nr:molecular chaperone DnaJ [Proteobacteria bacterium 005FR1]
MIIRLLFAIIVVIAISYALSRFRRQPAAERRKLAIKLGLYGLAFGILVLVATGRAHWLTALVAGIIPFFSRIVPLAIKLLPFLRQFQQQRMQNGAGGGTLQSRYLKLQLDRNSGRVSGQVLAGLFAGKALDELDQDELQQLVHHYGREDPESFRLLQAYLQQQHREWSFNYGGESRNAGAARGGDMSVREAHEILGLDEGASEQEILAAHKKLMQRLHPDRGGSNYLAVKVNQAKDLLVRRGR